MKLIELLRIVWINMVQNKYKVILTSLGIIVGTVTIVLVIAIGQGGEKKAADQYSFLSADTIYVNANYSVIGLNTDVSKLDVLTPETIENIQAESTTLKALYLRADSFKSCGINGQTPSLSIYGVTEDYAEASNLYAEIGSDLASEDFENEARVAVIGNNIATKYYDTASRAIGNKIKIGSYEYKIIGVLKKSGDGLQGLSADDGILIPYQTLVKDKQLDDGLIPVAVGKVHNIKQIPRAMKEIKSALNYYLEKGEIYSLEDAGSRIEAATESARTMSMLLLSVAIIVFVVGGIGIMNVLFVTVKERTREICVLKALGTTNADILKQFLLESAGIGVFGGTVGILISFIALYYMSFTDIPVLPSVGGKAAAFLFAVVTSAVFGFYPAYQASRLKPIEALNQE